MKIVIYTQRVDVVKGYEERRDCADQNIARFIKACGYFPLAISNVEEQLKDLVNRIRPVGIILTGGNSLEKYGGDAPERDHTDRMLIQIAHLCHIPLFGFCRGMQSILDYYNCPLKDIKGHVATKHLLYDGMQKIEVNSFHNQGAYSSEINAPMMVLAEAEDGIAEYVIHKNRKIIGTMWHPEREKEFCDHDILMVRKLFEEQREGENFESDYFGSRTRN